MKNRLGYVCEGRFVGKMVPSRWSQIEQLKFETLRHGPLKS